MRTFDLLPGRLSLATGGATVYLSNVGQLSSEKLNINDAGETDFRKMTIYLTGGLIFLWVTELTLNTTPPAATMTC